MRVRSTSVRATSRSIARRVSTHGLDRLLAVLSGERPDLRPRRGDLRLLEHKSDHAAARDAQRLGANVLAALIRTRHEHHRGMRSACRRRDDVRARTTTLRAGEFDVAHRERSVGCAAALDDADRERSRRTRTVPRDLPAACRRGPACLASEWARRRPTRPHSVEPSRPTSLAPQAVDASARKRTRQRRTTSSRTTRSGGRFS